VKKRRQTDRSSQWAAALAGGAMDLDGTQELKALYDELASLHRSPLPLEAKIDPLAPGAAGMRLAEGFVLIDPSLIRPGGDELARRHAAAADLLARHSVEGRQDAVRRVAAAGEGGKLDRLSRAYLDRGDEGARRELAALELDPEAGSFVLFNALKGAFIALGDLYRGADLSAWLHPHCPVCGGAPAMGLMEGEGGKRHLLCHRCETRWAWRRITCAFCGNADPHLLRYLTLEEEGEAPKMRIDACDSCRAYLKVRDQRAASGAFPEVEDLLTPRIDLAAARQGFHRGAPNVFGVRMGGVGEAAADTVDMG
jgi:hypothetical protein